MATPARWSRFPASDTTESAQPGAGRSAGQASKPIAFVVERRDYPAADVLEALVAAGYHVVQRQWAGTVQLAEEMRPQLIVAAISPNRAADLEVVRELARSCDAFVLLLADARSGYAGGLLAGASACLADADGREAFAAQVAAVLRRATGSHGDDAPSMLYVAGPLTVDTSAHRVEYHGQPVHLSPIEFGILAQLAKRQGTMCPAARIVEEVFPAERGDVPPSARLRSHILRIRRQLRAVAPNEDLITNVRGIGYRLDPPS